MRLRGYSNPKQFSDVLSAQDCTLRDRAKGKRASPVKSRCGSWDEYRSAPFCLSGISQTWHLITRTLARFLKLESAELKGSTLIIRNKTALGRREAA